MSKEIFECRFSPDYTRLVKEQIKTTPRGFFIADNLDLMMMYNRNLRVYIDKNKLKKRQFVGHYLSGSALGYALVFTKLRKETKNIEIGSEDIKLLIQDKNEWQDNFDFLVQKVYSCAEGFRELAEAFSGTHEFSPMRRSFEEGIVDATLPFISKIEAQDFSRKHSVYLK